MREMCFFKLFLFKALVRPCPLKSMRFWWLCFQHRSGKIIHPGLASGTLTHGQAPNTNSSPVEHLAQNILVTHHAGHAPSHCSDQKNWVCLFVFLICMRPPDYWRLCDIGMLGTFSSAAQAKEKPRAWCERLKNTHLCGVTPCTSKAGCSSCLLGMSRHR